MVSSRLCAAILEGLSVPSRMDEQTAANANVDTHVTILVHTHVLVHMPLPTHMDRSIDIDRQKLPRGLKVVRFWAI